MRRGPKRRPEARASSASWPRLFDVPRRLDQAGAGPPRPTTSPRARGRAAPEHRPAKFRPVDDKSDFREHLEVNAGRRTDEKEKSEDSLAVRRVEIDGLPEKGERE